MKYNLIFIKKIKHFIKNCIFNRYIRLNYFLNINNKLLKRFQ